MRKNNKFSCQTRIKDEGLLSEILDECALLFERVQRSLFKDYCSGKDLLKLKSSYLIRFGITARHFNACRVSLQGKIEANKEILSNRISELTNRVASLRKKIESLSGKKEKAFELHQKKRKLFNLEQKLEKLISDKQNEKVRLCFGSKKLFRAQFNLEKNGYSSKEEWKKDWEKKRSSTFFLLGSKDETSGNQSCVAMIQKDNTLTLRLRLPNALIKTYGKYIEIPNIHFTYGHDKIVSSLHSNIDKKGQAISYRFRRDKKSWLVCATTDIEKPTVVSKKELGAIGIDINANHLALVETDRFGNPINKRTIPLNTYGKSKHQTSALVGDAITKIVSYAKEVQKPIVLEDLDFKKKKATLKEESIKKHSRMLSSLAYNKVITMLKANAFRNGIETYSVNPAFTSIIGNVKFALRYGLTKHHAAALCIARRLYGYSENLPQSSITISDGKNDKLTLSLPERNRDKHVWSYWREVNKKIRVALAAHHLAKRNRSSSPLTGFV